MGEIKSIFNRFREVIAVLFFFICIFIIISFNTENLNLVTKIVVAIYSTGLYFVLYMLLKNKKK